MALVQPFDTQLFRLINQEYTHPFLDLIMPFVAGPYIWVILVLLMLLWVHKSMTKGKSRAGLVVTLSAWSCVGIAYSVEALILKPYFARLRPCHMLDQVHLLVDKCGGQFGLPSGHSTNAMALAIFFILVYRKPFLSFVLMGLALFIGYSRVYVGVHFPGDVMFGFIFGGLVAGLFHFVLRRYFSNVFTNFFIPKTKLQFAKK